MLTASTLRASSACCLPRESKLCLLLLALAQFDVRLRWRSDLTLERDHLAVDGQYLFVQRLDLALRSDIEQ